MSKSFRESFTPSTSDKSLVAQALRRVNKFCSPAYVRLVTLSWYWTKETPYGATDGRILLLNPDGIEKIRKTSDPVGYLAFLLVHESLHAMLNHGIRLASFKDRKTANIAADYVINAIIIKMNKDAISAGRAVRDPFPMIDGGLFDEDISQDKSVELLYREMMANPDTQPPARTNPTGSGDPDDDDDGDQSGGDMDKADDGGGDSKPKDGDDMGDDPDDWETDDMAPSDGDGDGDGDVGTGGSGYGRHRSDDPNDKNDADILGDFTGTGDDDGVFEPELGPDETMDDVANEIDAGVERIQIEEEINERAGASEGGDLGIDGIMQQRKRVKLGDWHESVRDWFNSRMDAGWTKPFNAPVYGSTRLVMAGRESKGMGPIAIAIDVSYSVPTGKVAEMLGEIQHALDTLKPECIHLIEIPSYVRHTWELYQGDTVPEELTYGGGTAFRPAFAWVEENVPDCEGMIYMTDGDSGDLRQLVEPEFPVLWLDWSCRPEKYPWGEVAVMADLDS